MKKTLLFIPVIICTLLFLTSCQSLRGLVELYGPYHEHSWSEWRTISDSTCSEAGSQLRACACGETQTQELELKMHKTGGWITDQDPECTINGSKHKYCTVCNSVLATDVIPATGHTAGNWVIEKEPTCTESGTKHLICTKCDQSIETQSIPAEHKEGIWIIDKESTCTEIGSKHQVCSACSATIKTESISALGHNYGDWKIDKAPTCIETGSKYQSCLECNIILKTENIPKGAHTYDISITPATLESNASVIYKCQICHYSYTEGISPITLTVSLTGSGTTYTSNGIFDIRTFTVTASGGYGSYKYKYEVYSSQNASSPSEIADYSNNAKYSYTASYGIRFSMLKVTVVDEAGQMAVYKIMGNGTFVDSYIKY